MLLDTYFLNLFQELERTLQIAKAVFLIAASATTGGKNSGFPVLPKVSCRPGRARCTGFFFSHLL